MGRILGRARDHSGTFGGAFRYRLGAANKVTKNKKYKYVVAIDGHQLAKIHATTNQKQSTAMEGTKDGRRDERVLGGIEFR